MTEFLLDVYFDNQPDMFDEMIFDESDLETTQPLDGDTPDYI